MGSLGAVWGLFGWAVWMGCFDGLFGWAHKGYLNGACLDGLSSWVEKGAQSLVAFSGGGGGCYFCYC